MASVPVFYPISINVRGNGDSEGSWTAHHMCVSLWLSPHSGGDPVSSFLQVHLLFSVACIPLTRAGWLCLPPLRASLLPVSLFAEPNTCSSDIFLWILSCCKKYEINKSYICQNHGLNKSFPHHLPDSEDGIPVSNPSGPASCQVWSE